MFHSPEHEQLLEDQAIERVMRRHSPPPPPTFMNMLRGMFWVSHLGRLLAPFYHRIMIKLMKRHERMCAEGTREDHED